MRPEGGWCFPWELLFLAELRFSDALAPVVVFGVFYTSVRGFSFRIKVAGGFYLWRNMFCTMATAASRSRHPLRSVTGGDTVELLRLPGRNLFPPARWR